MSNDWNFIPSQPIISYKRVTTPSIDRGLTKQSVDLLYTHVLSIRNVQITPVQETPDIWIINKKLA